MKTFTSLLLASAFYIGYIPGAPGTYASIATTLVYYLFIRHYRGVSHELLLSIICIITIIGVFTASEAGRSSGQEDPHFVVIDEVAGQLLTFLFVPISGTNLVFGTFLFRLFDIYKPFPIRRLERLGKGVGVMADDLLAGVYANIVLQIIYWLLRR
jgi:phosphatidylglycerophosphatase A